MEQDRTLSSDGELSQSFFQDKKAAMRNSVNKAGAEADLYSNQ
jgi:hypothetical protein